MVISGARARAGFLRQEAKGPVVPLPGLFLSWGVGLRRKGGTARQRFILARLVDELLL